MKIEAVALRFQEDPSALFVRPSKVDFGWRFCVSGNRVEWFNSLRSGRMLPPSIDDLLADDWEEVKE